MTAQRPYAKPGQSLPRSSGSFSNGHTSLAMYGGYIRPQTSDSSGAQPPVARGSVAYDSNTQNRQRNASINLVPKSTGSIDLSEASPPINPESESPQATGRTNPTASKSKDVNKPKLELQPPIISPVPLPNRPGTLTLSREPAGQVSAKEGGHTKPWPFSTEPPLIAPRFFDSKRADFSPWSGNHPEDKLTVESIKQGFSDKQQLPAEFQMARPTIWPSIKKGKGLQMLSTLYAAVLEEREAQGRITAPSTFKPPPRVTLTDAKREAWLRDLANASVPLRRLSRTIPHGVRGKSLLEQCSNKKIPIDRAVWLTKCVGANEIRAFRRKGAGSTLFVGGEAKWIREWTVQVEQWLEAIIAKCGEPAWGESMDYNLRLASSICLEGLLDQDHFLDWIVISFDNCSLDSVPIWLLAIQLFKTELINYRKTGSRLAEASLQKLHLISKSPDASIFAPVSERLRQLVIHGVKSYRENLINAKIWQRHRSLLSAILKDDSESGPQLVNDISQRCERLIPTQGSRTPNEGVLLRILDSSLDPIDPSSIWRRCQDVPNVISIFVPTVFKWATSHYREGGFRTFLGARLLRKAKSQKYSIETPILQILGGAADKKLEDSAVFHLLSELIRSNTFSPSKYLSWLIAGGVLHGNLEKLEDLPSAVRLLVEMPLKGMPDRVVNLRRTLLENLRFPADQEILAVNGAISSMTGLLSTAQDGPTNDDLRQQIARFVESLSSTSWMLKSELGRWIRSWIAFRYRPKQTEAEESSLEDEGSLQPCSFTQLQVIISVLESSRDFSILADIFKMLSSSSNMRILASIVDHLNDKSWIFQSIGAFEDCLGSVITQYEILKAQQAPDEALVSSLMEAKCRRATAAAACSPVSEHMMETNQSDEANFTEEIERALASGNTIDKPTLDKLFNAIIARIDDVIGSAKSDLNLYDYGQLLAKLGQLETQYFHELMLRWLSKLYINSNRPRLSRIIPSLCVSRCTNVSVALAAFDSRDVQVGIDQDKKGCLVIELLELFSLDTEKSLDTLDNSRCIFRSQKAEAERTRSLQLLAIIASSVSALPKQISQSGGAFANIVLNDPAIESILKSLTIHNTIDVLKVLIRPQHDTSEAEYDILQLMVQSMYKGKSFGVDSSSSTKLLESIVNETDIFSYPFAKLQFAMIFSKKSLAASSQDELMSAFLKAIDSSHPQYTQLLADLVLSLGPSIAVKVCDHATTALQTLLPGPRPIFSNPSALESKLDSAELYMLFIEVTASAAVELQAKSQMALAAERIIVLEHVLEDLQRSWSASQATGSPQISNKITAHLREICSWLCILLRLVMHWRFHFPSIQRHAKEQSLLVISLCSILVLPMLQTDEHDAMIAVQDVVSALVDDLSDDARAQCVRALREKAHDRRIQYLIGIKPTQHEGLSISCRGRLSSFVLRPWETLSEPTPNFGENDTSLNLTLFQARKF